MADKEAPTFTVEQLQALISVARHSCSITKAAAELGISQSGLTRRIQALEHALGMRLLDRRGRNILGLTDDGLRVLEQAQPAVTRLDQIQALAKVRPRAGGETLALAATQTLTLHVLPPLVARFREAHPQGVVHVQQGEPTRMAHLVRAGEVDFALATESFHLYDGLQLHYTHRWRRCLIAPKGSGLLQSPVRTLAEMAALPLVTYGFGLGGGELDLAFRAAGEPLRIAVAATDAEVIKAYTREGHGVGLVATMAVCPGRDADLMVQDVTDLLGWGRIAVAVMAEGAALPPHALDFLRLFAPGHGDFTERGARSANEAEDGAGLPWMTPPGR